MRIEGLTIQGFDQKNRERNGKIIKWVVVSLKNSDGDIISIRTEKKSVSELAAGPCDLTITPQQKQVVGETT